VYADELVNSALVSLQVA